MLKHFKYLSYVLKHKWYVFLACLNDGLIWRGIIHDIDKFYPSEWFPYVERFYGGNGNIKRGRDNTGYYVPTESGPESFHLAWNYHQKRNKHHWQWWVLPGERILPMDDKSRREMICDWIGAGRAQKTGTAYKWWEANKGRMQFHDETKKWVEMMMGGGDAGL